jgi:hypothetical protein
MHTFTPLIAGCAYTRQTDTAYQLVRHFLIIKQTMYRCLCSSVTVLLSTFFGKHGMRGDARIAVWRDEEAWPAAQHIHLQCAH